MMNRNLRKAVLAGLGIAALAGVSTQASAIGTQNVGDGNGVFSGTTLSSLNWSNPSSWDGQNNGTGSGTPKNSVNYGWAHHSDWYTFSVVNGAGANGVDVKVKGTNFVNGFTTNPALSLYSTTSDFNGSTHSASKGGYGMSYNQVADQNGTANAWMKSSGTYNNTPWTATGSVTSFVGYANSGVIFISGKNGPTPTAVGMGGFGAGYSGSYAGTGSGVADLYLGSLANGNYMIAIGGNCNAGIGCTNRLDYQVTVSVPEPEEYLMMLMGAGMVGFQVKRKKAKQALTATA